MIEMTVENLIIPVMNLKMFKALNNIFKIFINEKKPLLIYKFKLFYFSFPLLVTNLFFCTNIFYLKKPS